MDAMRAFGAASVSSKNSGMQMRRERGIKQKRNWAHLLLALLLPFLLSRAFSLSGLRRTSQPSPARGACWVPRLCLSLFFWRRSFLLGGWPIGSLRLPLFWEKFAAPRVSHIGG
jgi:hypothetical protein